MLKEWMSNGMTICDFHRCPFAALNRDITDEKQ